MERLNEVASRRQVVASQLDESDAHFNRLQKEVQDQAQKLDRADKAHDTRLNNLRAVQPDFDPHADSDANRAIEGELAMLKNKYLLNVIG